MRIPNAFFAGALLALVIVTVLAVLPVSVHVGDVWVYVPQKKPGSQTRIETNVVLAVEGNWISYSNSTGCWRVNRGLFVAGAKKVSQ